MMINARLMIKFRQTKTLPGSHTSPSALSQITLKQQAGGTQTHTYCSISGMLTLKQMLTVYAGVVYVLSALLVVVVFVRVVNLTSAIPITHSISNCTT